MRALVWAPAAEDDLDDIFNYIADQDQRPSTAADLLRKIESKVRLCATQPRMGTARPDLGEGLRIVRHTRYAIVYRSLSDGIEVLRVLDGHRDYPRLFT